MVTIWKYPVPILDTFYLGLRLQARVLDVQLQDGSPKMWVQQDFNQPREVAVFHVVGTGHPHPDDWTYISTWQQDGFVWHLFREEVN